MASRRKYPEPRPKGWLTAAWRPARRATMHLLMGRRFMRALEANRAAADRLDLAVREALGR
ncbi:hypothetical protein [Tropicimonas sp.]|uniref:hypothetical protein n=1 Tax=Tropicimonas sp. TaxID=2067044 RepID=UPI003A889FD6